MNTHTLNRWLRSIALILVCAMGVAHAGPKDPITGDPFERWVRSQNTAVQDELVALFPEEAGHIVTGPLDPLYEGTRDAESVYHAIRVLCSDLTALEEAAKRIRLSNRFKIRGSKRNIEKSRTGDLVGYRGVIVEIEYAGGTSTIQFGTLQQTRWLIWKRRIRDLLTPDVEIDRLNRYAVKVSDYLFIIDRGDLLAEAPSAEDFGLPEPFSLYPAPPAYVIEDYQDYKNFLRRHAVIHTDFAKGVLNFVPGDSLLNALKANAPRTAYPNKEHPMLQGEFREFLERGGKLEETATLTADRFAGLEAGEYFFAVGLSGRIRFGRELLREEVRRIERETGRKLARANHAFLFPGEPILTAGTFWIERPGTAHLSRVDTRSGHYFYSNVTGTVREDIAVNSDQYILTIGHFFAALDRAGISYDAVPIGK